MLLGVSSLYSSDELVEFDAAHCSKSRMRRTESGSCISLALESLESLSSSLLLR